MLPAIKNLAAASQIAMQKQAVNGLQESFKAGITAAGKIGSMMKSLLPEAKFLPVEASLSAGAKKTVCKMSIPTTPQAFALKGLTSIAQGTRQGAIAAGKLALPLEKATNKTAASLMRETGSITVGHHIQATGKATMNAMTAAGKKALETLPTKNPADKISLAALNGAYQKCGEQATKTKEALSPSLLLMLGGGAYLIQDAVKEIQKQVQTTEVVEKKTTVTPKQAEVIAEEVVTTAPEAKEEAPSAVAEEVVNETKTAAVEEQPVEAPKLIKTQQKPSIATPSTSIYYDTGVKVAGFAGVVLLSIVAGALTSR